MCLNVQVEVKGKRGKPSVMVTEDEEFKKVNFDKFAKLPTVFQVSGDIFQFCKIWKLLERWRNRDCWKRLNTV